MSAFVDGDIFGPGLRCIGVSRWSGEYVDPFGCPGHHTVASGVVWVEYDRDPFGIYFERLHHSGPVSLEECGIFPRQGVYLLRVYEYVVLTLYLSPSGFSRVIPCGVVLSEGRAGHHHKCKYTNQMEISPYIHNISIFHKYTNYPLIKRIKNVDQNMWRGIFEDHPFFRVEKVE